MIKKYIVAFVLCIQSIYAQNTEISITLSFENIDLLTAIEKIEEKSKYTFFFQDSWLEEYQSISRNYENADINVVLSDLFKDTLLNFFIIEKERRVILTRNNRIYDYLPDGFIIDEETDKVKENNIITQSQSFGNILSSKVNNAGSEIIRIGKSVANSNQKSFNISGRISNKQTQRGVADAKIIVNGRDLGVQTDKNGFFVMSIKGGQYLIEIDALGMERIKKNVIIYNDGTLNIAVKERVELLDEVILESEKNTNVDNTVTKTEIDVKESKNIPLALGERNVLKVATTLPGITTAGEGANGYNVRGGKSDQNLILLDDAVIYNPQHFFGIFSALNPFALGEANIYKSSIPVEYGGRLSSVFDLKTKDASKEKVAVEGSIGPVTGNLLAEIPVVKNKSGIMIGGRGAYANWILSSLDEESLKNSEASFYDAIAKYNHQIGDKTKIEATAYWSRDDFSITSDSLYVYGNRAFSLRLNHRFNEKNSVKVAASNSQYSFDIEFDGDADNDFELGYKINESELKLQFKYLYNDKIKLDYGVSGKLYEVNPGTLQPKGPESIIDPLEIEKERGLESGAFIASEIDIFKGFTLNAGIRYSLYNALGSGTQNVFQEGVPKDEGTIVETLTFDNNEVIKTYGGPETRVSARYLFTDDFSVKASYNKTFQYIHTLSNNTTVSPIDTWKLSDLNIEPQSSQQYSLGLYKNFADAMFEMSLEGFYKRSENILDFKTGAEILLNENIETEVLQGKGKAYGVEFLLKKQKGKLYGWLGYTYSRSFLQLDSPFDEERVNNGDFFPSNFDKPHDFSLVTNYKFTKRFSVSTNFVYQTGRPVTFPIGTFSFDDTEFAVFSARNKFRIPDFYRLDIGLNIEGNHKRNKLAHGFWTISVYNVLGRNNPLSVYFVTEDGEVKGLQSSVFSIPIPSITYNFKF
ncbi:TonB-dependent receptor [Aquimarina gracilis]|uniref:TonB-dependent receptor n=1 Tax=Aquimarina gracilis TaxID=874422 RepID=A0ABU5ZW86_9FLAO|nr:TonB-dependent receptor [Aquimarina gracilis]MEB3346136.1 TonB-dependent receptor [Aquimarina gracilis]